GDPRCGAHRARCRSSGTGHRWRNGRRVRRRTGDPVSDIRWAGLMVTIAAARRRLVRFDARWGVPVVLVVWLGLWVLLRGQHTLALGTAELTDVHRSLNRLNDTIGANRNSSPVFVYFFNEIRLAIDTLVTFIRELISTPTGTRPVPQVGWLGVTAVAGVLAFGFGTWRVALLTTAGLLP